jgi:pimeloyl-ACP methyl ester carboxylesterase
MSFSQERLEQNLVHIPIGGIILDGNLDIPQGAQGIVLFAHGSGSSRHSPRNRFVADSLLEGNLATLLVDLLTEEEEQVDMITRHLRFNINLLTDRLVGIIHWLENTASTRSLNIGLFGASTGAAAALVTASLLPEAIDAVVSRGGRPDLAGLALRRVEAPTLLIVGGNDDVVIDLNRQAQAEMHAVTQLEIIPGATHLFEEPGTLEEVARLAREWFTK